MRLFILYLFFLQLFYFQRAAQTIPTSNMETYDVIIVGAGVAGLKAASDLIANDYSNLLIIEADDRIGGRVHTIELGIL